MFEDAVGSCDVVDIRVGLHVDEGAILRELACITLGDGPGIGTLGSSGVGNHGCSTLGDGVSMASGFVDPGWSIGRIISYSF